MNPAIIAPMKRYSTLSRLTSASSSLSLSVFLGPFGFFKRFRSLLVSSDFWSVYWVCVGKLVEISERVCMDVRRCLFAKYS